MKLWGYILLAIGTCAALFALVLMTSTVSSGEMSVYGSQYGATGLSETFNLARAQSREMLLHTSLAVMVIGTIFAAAGAIIEEQGVTRRSSSQPSVQTVSPMVDASSVAPTEPAPDRSAINPSAGILAAGRANPGVPRDVWILLIVGGAIVATFIIAVAIAGITG